MKLPTNRAFLVRLSADADPAHHRINGRVEHVRSGRSAVFESTDGLYAFVSEVLESEEPDHREAALMPQED